jgi:hypothetical protein
VLTVLAAIIATTTVQGAGVTMVFVLIVAARVVDLTLSDGAARTSLSAAYQAVPNRLRGVAQATVEGLAVPIAIGFSGVVLLLVDQVDAIDSLALPVMTGVVSLVLVVRGDDPLPRVRRQPARRLRGRTLDLASLVVDDESTVVVIDRLVGERRRA